MKWYSKTIKALVWGQGSRWIAKSVLILSPGPLATRGPSGYLCSICFSRRLFYYLGQNTTGNWLSFMCLHAFRAEAWRPLLWTIFSKMLVWWKQLWKTESTLGARRASFFTVWCKKDNISPSEVMPNHFLQSITKDLCSLSSRFHFCNTIHSSFCCTKASCFSKYQLPLETQLLSWLTKLSYYFPFKMSN